MLVKKALFGYLKPYQIYDLVSGKCFDSLLYNCFVFCLFVCFSRALNKMKQFRKLKKTSGFSFKIYLLLTFLIDMTLSSNTSKVGLFLRVFTYSRVGRFKVWFVQLREYGRRRRVLFGLNNSSFSTYAKFSEKLNISNVRVHIRGLEILLFRKMLLARIK